MSVVTALLVLVRQTVCYITRGAQSPDGLSWWLEEVGMVVREDTSLPCQVTRLHWEPRVSVDIVSTVSSVSSGQQRQHWRQSVT